MKDWTQILRWDGRLAVAALTAVSFAVPAGKGASASTPQKAHARAVTATRVAAAAHGKTTGRSATQRAGNSSGKSAGKAAGRIAGKSAGRKVKAAAKTGARGAKERPASRAERAEVAKAEAAATVRSIRLNSAFVATAQLRPMAQQLVNLRTPAAYAGIAGYAQQHPGVQAATAYLALGHAYTLDRRYDEASAAFRQASGAAGDTLGDYADYLGAQALVQSGRVGDAVPLLDHFSDRHPESIFAVSAPMLLANAELTAKNGPAAVAALEPLESTPEGAHADFRLTLARAYQLAGDQARAVALYRAIYNQQPLTNEAVQARVALVAAGQSPSAAERKLHADQLFNAKHYGEASVEYDSLKNDSSLSQADRDGLAIYRAVCDLKLKHLSRKEAERLPATTDDTAALKLYLLAEISRTEKDREQHDQIVAQMIDRFPKSRWTEEALYSGGNMYLLTHDAQQAIYHYKLLVGHFPTSVYAPSAHWREAWMNYRLRRYPEAARLMDEQVVQYGAGIEASSALYWRGRIYEENEKDFAQAAAYYRAVSANYTNFYYGDLARKRLAVLGQQPAVAPTAALNAVRKVGVVDLSGVVPETDPHYIKAKLLANAALNEYIGPEIAASPGSGQWGALAQAEIYSSYGEVTRALQSMKRSGIPFFSLPTAQVPETYWRLMFPQPYWGDLVADSQKNGLDPFLVASLIRQESEFNAGAVSPAHALGLMQLLAGTGKDNAKKEGIKGFQANMLLNPGVNLQLGTRNLRGVLDRFGGQPEYALAAYNAGDVPVRQWIAGGEFKDLPEFVESIPYTETREYVQAILRNREMYRMLYGTH